MKKFEQFGTPLTRSEAKEIRGGMYDIEKPIRDNEDPESGGGGRCVAHCDDGQVVRGLPNCTEASFRGACGHQGGNCNC